MIQQFDVHKSILIGRSDVFAAMIMSCDMAEKRGNKLTIKDIKPDALKEMLRFFYTDQVRYHLILFLQIIVFSDFVGHIFIIFMLHGNVSRAKEILSIKTMQREEGCFIGLKKI